MSPSAPVGIFDSGMGGLSVAHEIRALLPAEDLLYLADSAYCPYGDRSLEEIRARSLACVGELLARGSKAVVVACNTATGAALEQLREAFDVPIIGLEPAVKPAAQRTRTGRIGVMATAATLRTGRFDRLVENHARGVQVVRVACPGLADRVEEGETSGPALRATLEGLTRPLREAGVDIVVLGCTHYPFLRAPIAEVLGPEVEVIDSGAAIARRVEQVLREGGMEARAGRRSGMRLLTTWDPADVAPVAERLWGEPLAVEYASL